MIVQELVEELWKLHDDAEHRKTRYKLKVFAQRVERFSYGTEVENASSVGEALKFNWANMVDGKVVLVVKSSE